MARSICAGIVVLFQADVTQSMGKTWQTRRALISLNLSGVGRLCIEPLWTARPKPLIFREMGADDAGLIGPDPRYLGNIETQIA